MELLGNVCFVDFGIVEIYSDIKIEVLQIDPYQLQPNDIKTSHRYKIGYFYCIKISQTSIQFTNVSRLEAAHARPSKKL